MGLKEISYNISETESSALPSFTRTLENLEEAVSCISGIDTSGLGLNLNTDQIKADIETIISEIHTIVTNVKSILDELVRVEQENAEIIKYYLGEEDITEFYKKISEIFETVEPQEIWNEDIKHELIDCYGEFKISRPKNDDGTPKPIIICELNDGESFVQGSDSLFDGFNGYVIFLHSSDLEEETFDSIINTCQEDVYLNCNIDLNRKVELKESKVRKLFSDIATQNSDTATQELEKMFATEIVEDTDKNELWKDVTEWITKVANIGGKIIKKEIPLFTGLYQNDKDNKDPNNKEGAAAVPFGKNTMSTDGCAIFSYLHVRYYWGAEGTNSKSLKDWAQIYKGVNAAGSDGGTYGGVAHMMEYCGAEIVFRYPPYSTENTMTTEEAKDLVREYANEGYLLVSLQLNSADFCPMKEDVNGLHFVTSVGMNEDDRLIVWDSNWFNRYNVDKTIDRTANYEAGFDLDTFITDAKTIFVVAPEPRTELQRDPEGSIIVKDGNVLLIDYTQEPVIDEQAFEDYCTANKKYPRDSLIRDCGFNGDTGNSDALDAKILYTTEEYRTNGQRYDGKVNVTQSSGSPIQFPTREITIEEAIEIGAITEEEARTNGWIP